MYIYFENNLEASSPSVLHSYLTQLLNISAESSRGGVVRVWSEVLTTRLDQIPNQSIENGISLL